MRLQTFLWAGRSQRPRVTTIGEGCVDSLTPAKAHSSRFRSPRNTGVNHLSAWERRRAFAKNANVRRGDRAVRLLPTTADMPGRLRSSVAIVVVGLLLGSTTLPLVPCAGRCPTEMLQAPPPRHCHQSSARATSLSCCCSNERKPASTPVIPVAAERSLALVVSIVPAIAPTTRQRKDDLEPASLLVHSRLLFLLNSVLLI